MQYTDNEAALIGGLISTYFFQPAVSAPLKDAYSRVLEHLHQNVLTSSDRQQEQLRGKPHFHCGAKGSGGVLRAGGRAVPAGGP